MGNLVDALLSQRLQTLFSTPGWFVFLFVCFSDTLALEMQDISQFYEQEGNAPNIATTQSHCDNKISNSCVLYDL